MKSISILILLLTLFNPAFSQVTNLGPGLWSNTALWSNNQLPGSNDSVTLNFDVTVDVSAICKALNTNGHNVTINSGVVFNVMNSPVDIDGNVYNTTAICNRVWTRENLDVTRYRNGDTIPQVADSLLWLYQTSGAWCYYNNDTANAIYGKLYNWYAVNDPRGIAPVGWHVPTDAEWGQLHACLGYSSVAGGKMKETGLVHWAAPNTGATNSSGFTGLPGGGRGVNGSAFHSLSFYGYWWSSTAVDATLAMYHSLVFDGEHTSSMGFDKRLGRSIRLIKD
jgi:uncharacterized protein (TIGR02145 family)